ncbi:coagulation factor 5/8 type domain-containing protein [Catenovulum agarivorans DS-2]|uniref:Coagulation factor 5/8 type domain-containing protein n=1 Tax=Catenovulum agarivorans DS-2 TaxID=1328313 RepID=W7QD24_9ALTE|nr:discoidin domain-containing protein [Catenovulum agarivorans]EWH09816.1 coagulation factor 5/8 type domain-containing protein [Catenovulum agarivorans DS-2]
MKILNISTFCKLLVSLLPAAFSSTIQANEQVVALSPQQSLATMVVQDGFKMELVAHEPMVEEPVLLSFDAKGRMYVAEMLTYMQNADGTGQMQPTSRIKRLEDTNNDGIMDTATVFADNLLLPRMVLPLADGQIIVRETNTLDLLLIEDTNGDGVADTRKTIFEGGKRGGNLEHQPSGLIWGIDNWLYVTYTNRRYKFVDGKIISQDMRYGGGQWGLGQDEVGRHYFTKAGAEKPGFSFQFPIVYGAVPIKGELAEGFSEVFPIEYIPDVQGGLPRVREDGSLNHFTGVAGPSVYLGDKLPELYGNYFVPEPVGNLVRRAIVDRKNGYTTITHPYQAQQKEFIASTDSSFRPVWSETGPDGTLYLVDMYRGIIQEGNWTQKGSYLREVIDKYGLDKIIGGGRIYRVTKPGVERGEQPNMFADSSEKLVEYLAHKNQWWRLNAQKQLVLRKDTSVAANLKTMALKHQNPLARLHALWTLDGLGIFDKNLIIQAMQDPHSYVNTAAVRISEQAVTKSDQSMIKIWQSLLKQADIELAQQILLSVFYVQTSEQTQNRFTKLVKQKYPDSKSVKAIVRAMDYLVAEEKAQAKLAGANKEFAASMARGKQNFNSMCASCHGADGKGTKAGDGLIAPSFANNKRVNGDLAILGRIVLQGLIKPIEGKSYLGGMMASVGLNSDEWIADSLTYIRNNFGNSASAVTPEQIADLRKIEPRTTPWTLNELNARFGNKLSNRNEWKFNASHNPTNFESLIDGQLNWNRWDSQEKQAVGMWFQIELPDAHYISQIDMDCRDASRLCARAFDVAFSLDGVDWTPVHKQIEFLDKHNIQTLGRKTRFIRFVLTNGSSEHNWAITELNLIGSKAQAPNFALHPALNASNTHWDESTKTLSINRSVQFVPDSSKTWTYAQMDKLKDQFYWDIPCEIKTLVIDKNVTVTGHLRMTCEQTIQGKDRFSSIIYGTPTKAWARGENQKEDDGTDCARNGQPAKVAGDDILHDCEKWQYSGISVANNAPNNAVYSIKNLTVENARTYAITSIRHTFYIDGVNILNTREYPDFQSNSDGIGGGEGTVIKNTYIDTWDDSIKLYREGMHVENVTIIHNANGSPFQLGWGKKPTTNHTLKNIKIVYGASKNNRFNLPLFANSGGKVDAHINIDGMLAEYDSSAILSKCTNSQAMPLVYLKHPQSQLTITFNQQAPAVFTAPAKYCGEGQLVWPETAANSAAKESVTGCLGCEPKL